jgi:hypothetical protein
MAYRWLTEHWGTAWRVKQAVNALLRLVQQQSQALDVLLVGAFACLRLSRRLAAYALMGLPPLVGALLQLVPAPSTHGHETMPQRPQ